MRVESAGNGRARLRQLFRENQLRPGGTISGPTMMGLADAAMYAAILGQLGRLEMAVTQNLNINFLARPQASDLIAEAEIIRLGRRSAVLEVRLFSRSEEHTSELQSRPHLVCRLLLEKKKQKTNHTNASTILA